MRLIFSSLFRSKSSLMGRLARSTAFPRPARMAETQEAATEHGAALVICYGVLAVIRCCQASGAGDRPKAREIWLDHSRITS